MAIDGLAMALLAAFVILICVFIAVLQGQAYLKDFKQTKSKVKRRVSNVFKDEAETCNHCGNSLPPSHDPQADCPFCGHKPYRISDLVTNRDVLDGFNDTICANPDCNYNLKKAEQGGRVDRCPKCKTQDPYGRR